MNDFIFTALVLLLGALIHAATLRRHEPSERRLLTLGFVAHLASALGQILLYRFYYNGGDMISYYEMGVPISEALRRDFTDLFPMTVDAFFQRENRLPFELAGGGSTGTMSVAAVWLLFVLGDSLIAVTLFIGVLSYLSKVLIYRTLRDQFEGTPPRTILLAVLLVPSAVFWTSALLKEPIIAVFLGPLFLALRWTLAGRRLWLAGVVTFAAGSVIWLLKPYVLVSFAAAAGVWLVWQRVLKQRGHLIVKPLYLVAGLALSLGAFIGADRFLPKTEGQNITDAMAHQRRVSAREEGGSNYYLEEPTHVDVEAKMSLGSQLALVPLALVTAFFRPFLFEVRNSVQALNALETTWILVLFVQMVRRQRWSDLVLRILNSPALLFSFTFSLVMALGTGLSSANLGTLSRYRAPMMPFVVLLFLVLRKPAGARVSVVRLSALDATSG